jgi:glycosyltransferase involved in cell wall biosynthesis
MTTPVVEGAAPLVSVIVPNYNHARYLDQRIQSILLQTFQDFEILLLDDRSTDDSPAVLSKYADHPKVAGVFVNEANGGSPYLQWNRGARMARGRYLWLAESDDYAAPTFLERLVAVMEAQPRVGLAYCRSLKVDEHSHVFGSTDDWTRDLDATRWSHDHVNSGPDECARFMIRRCIIPNVSSALLRHSVLSRIGYAEEAMKYCGDYFTYVRMLEVSDVAYTAEPLNYFRFSNTTVRNRMTNSWRHDHERAQIIAYIAGRLKVPPATLEDARDALLEHLARASISSWPAARIYFGNYLRTREVVARFCPWPEARVANLLRRVLLRKTRRVLRRALALS